MKKMKNKKNKAKFYAIFSKKIIVNLRKIVDINTKKKKRKKILNIKKKRILKIISKILKKIKKIKKKNLKNQKKKKLKKISNIKKNWKKRQKIQKDKQNADSSVKENVIRESFVDLNIQKQPHNKKKKQDLFRNLSKKNKIKKQRRKKILKNKIKTHKMKTSVTFSLKINVYLEIIVISHI